MSSASRKNTRSACSVLNTKSTTGENAQRVEPRPAGSDAAVARRAGRGRAAPLAGGNPIDCPMRGSESDDDHDHDRGEAADRR